MKLSLVIPCFNEAGNVPLFLDEVSRVLDGLCDYEFVFIDDGSTDDTWKQLQAALSGQHNIQAIRFSRNFGKESAIYAGLKHAKGEYVSIIDADLQQRPEVVKDMVEILDARPDVDAVAAYQDKRRESKLLSFFKGAFYAMINRISKTKLVPNASDFRTLRRRVVDSILAMGEYHRFSKGIFSWVGYETVYIPYTVAPRATGTSKWNFRKLTRYAIDGIIGFTTAPLRLATYMGLASACLAIIYLVVVLIQKLCFSIAIPGYATIIVLILFLGGMQLFCLGLIGEYVGRIFEQTKDRPIYLVKEVQSNEDSR